MLLEAVAGPPSLGDEVVRKTHRRLTKCDAVRRKGREVPWHSLAMTRGRMIELSVVLCRVVSLANRQDAGKSQGETPTP